MEMEAYFEHVAPDCIRVRGTRVGIETVLWDYKAGASPEEIVLRYPTLSLEQVHATITYYLHRRDALDQYLLCAAEQGVLYIPGQADESFVSELRGRLEEQRMRLGDSRRDLQAKPAA
jgi:uncharacterized protein (DUF433 family)